MFSPSMTIKPIYYAAACVNSVRWSCNGRYLASGGDDRLIMIWQFAGVFNYVCFINVSNINFIVILISKALCLN